MRPFAYVVGVMLRFCGGMLMAFTLLSIVGVLFLELLVPEAIGGLAYVFVYFCYYIIGGFLWELGAWLKKQRAEKTSDL